MGRSVEGSPLVGWRRSRRDSPRLRGHARTQRAISAVAAGGGRAAADGLASRVAFEQTDRRQALGSG
jgi:hypothetical protein